MDFAAPLRVVSPTLDAEVLGVLASSPEYFVVRQIQRVMGRGSLEGIRRVLRRLVREGIVHEMRTGNTVAYWLNTDHLAAPDVIRLADARRTLLDRLAELLDGWETPPVVAGVFGSVARGEARAGSDLDLFLVRPPAAGDAVWDSQVRVLSERATAWTGNDARPFEIDLAEDDLAREPVLQDILREGLFARGSATDLRQLLRLRLR